MLFNIAIGTIIIGALFFIFSMFQYIEASKSENPHLRDKWKRIYDTSFCVLGLGMVLVLASVLF